MILHINNDTYSIRDFSFTVNVDEDDATIIQYRVECSLLSFTEVDMMELARQIVDEAIHSISIEAATRNYNFDNLTFENVNMYVNDNMEEISLIFIKQETVTPTSTE